VRATSINGHEPAGRRRVRRDPHGRLELEDVVDHLAFFRLDDAVSYWTGEGEDEP
jgi:hypothetical protein